MKAAPLLDAERVPSLLDLLLDEQQQLTAVERFAQRQADAGEVRWYRDLIPATPPGPGQQYAFRVDLDSCTGCKACVTACHSLNGLAPEETWRDVGVLLGVGESAGVQQTVTTACHHCEDPACLAGCPVRAYEKDPVTGIVRHLDDQCIGCQYCVLKCPYDVPKYNAALGIVRKCDMCSDRLAAGEAPACVQGCPTSAISIEAIDVGRTPAPLLPVAAHTIPDPAYTRPTTRYVSARDRGALRPANEARLAPADPHHPLSVMLVLTQLGAGAIAFEAARALGAGASAAGVAIGLAATLFGMAAANLHLGRPLYAFRVVLGLRTSWMSREIVALGAFAGAATAFAACAWLPPLAALAPWTGAGAAAIGALAVLCSVMIYADTRRPLWRFQHTAPLFAMTCIALGAGAFCVAEPTAAVALAWAATSATKLCFESSLRAHLGAPALTAMKRSALLVAGPLRRVARARVILGCAFGVVLPIAVAITGSASLAAVALAGNTIAEWLERNLFFRAQSTPAMPGA
jgi:Fe-S-cluster-containing dehydrogenase component/DMSO reductase anchor subunit